MRGVSKDSHALASILRGSQELAPQDDGVDCLTSSQDGVQYEPVGVMLSVRIPDQVWGRLSLENALKLRTNAPRLSWDHAPGPGAREAVSTMRMRSAALRAPSFFMMFAR